MVCVSVKNCKDLHVKKSFATVSKVSQSIIVGQGDTANVIVPIFNLGRMWEPKFNIFKD